MGHSCNAHIARAMGHSCNAQIARVMGHSCNAHMARAMGHSFRKAACMFHCTHGTRQYRIFHNTWCLLFVTIKAGLNPRRSRQRILGLGGLAWLLSLLLLSKAELTAFSSKCVIGHVLYQSVWGNINSHLSQAITHTCAPLLAASRADGFAGSVRRGQEKGFKNEDH